MGASKFGGHPNLHENGRDNGENECLGVGLRSIQVVPTARVNGSPNYSTTSQHFVRTKYRYERCKKARQCGGGILETSPHCPRHGGSSLRREFLGGAGWRRCGRISSTGSGGITDRKSRQHSLPPEKTMEMTISSGEQTSALLTFRHLLMPCLRPPLCRNDTRCASKRSPHGRSTT